MNNFFLVGLTTNPSGFWGAIRGIIFAWVNSFLDDLLLPTGLLVCGVFFVWLLIQCIADYKAGHGDQIQGKIMFMILIVVIAALLATKALWWSFVFGG